MSNVPVFKKDRSKHNELRGKLRSVRHNKAVQMAVHLIMGGVSKSWSLSEDRSLISYTKDNGKFVAYSLTGDVGQIEALVAERTEANAKRAAEAEKAKADAEALRVQTENDNKAKAVAEAAKALQAETPATETPAQAPSA